MWSLSRGCGVETASRPHDTDSVRATLYTLYKNVYLWISSNSAGCIYYLHRSYLHTPRITSREGGGYGPFLTDFGDYNSLAFRGAHLNNARPSSIQEIIVLLVEDNCLSPEQIEFSQATLPVNLKGRDQSGSPAAHLDYLRGRSPLLLPVARGERKGIPAAWTEEILRFPAEIPDKAAREALDVGVYARRSLGVDADAAHQAFRWVLRTRTGLSKPGEGAGGKEWQIYQDFLAEKQSKPIPRVGRTPVPPLPPEATDRRRGRPRKGSQAGDVGLLCYLPGFAAWLRKLELKSGLVAVRTLLSSLPDLTVIPHPTELTRALRLRQGRIQGRGARAGWEAFRAFMWNTHHLALPSIPGDPIPMWRVPTEVARAAKRLMGKAPQDYRGAQTILREDVLAGNIPCAYQGGCYTSFRTLDRGEKDWAQTLLDWNPKGSPKDPLFAMEPGSPTGVPGYLIWNRVRFLEI